MNPAVKRLLSEYNKRRSEIKKRIGEFRSLRRAGDEDLFSELCFCILTANANALLCDKAIMDLKEGGLLSKGSARNIRPKLRGRVRFHNKKAGFIVMARDLFKFGRCLDVKGKIDTGDISATRDWLVGNVKGLGYKEASHFLRNIGLGRDIAILDRHILKNLKRHGVIRRIPSSVASRKVYKEIEDRMRRFSKKVKIPLDELDLLFWSIQTGFVFK